MPPAAKTPGLDPGTEAEVRVARSWFWDGYYVRRGVDLQHRFAGEVSTVTDLDVVGIFFDPTLATHKAIGEVKSGSAKSTPRPLDRALWLRGLREIVGAESGEITTAFRASSVVRDACSRLGITIQHLDDLALRESRLRIATVKDVGSQSEAVALLRADVASFVKSDPMLERGYWFLVSEVWFLEPFDALKRTLGLVRQLSKIWPPESDVQANRVARWFLAEAVSITMVNLAVVAGQANTMDPRAFANAATAQLSSGDIPFHAMRALSDRVDEYVGKLLASLNAPAAMQANALGAFMPSPPDYAEPLLELISRLAAEAATTARLPRQLDAILFERLVHRRELAPEVYARLNLSPSSERLIRLVAAFLRGQFNLANAVDNVLTAPLSQYPAGTPASPKQVNIEVQPQSDTLTEAKAPQQLPLTDAEAAPQQPPAETEAAPPKDKSEDASGGSPGGVRPNIVDAVSTSASQSASRSRTRRSLMVIENQTDSPVTDVDFRYENLEGNPVSDFDVLAMKHNRTEALGPFESVSFPLIQAWGSPDSAVCVVDWTDKEGVRHSSRTTVRVP